MQMLFWIVTQSLGRKDCVMSQKNVCVGVLLAHRTIFSGLSERFKPKNLDCVYILYFLKKRVLTIYKAR